VSPRTWISALAITPETGDGNAIELILGEGGVGEQEKGGKEL
jgi:hypothetical protein